MLVVTGFFDVSGSPAIKLRIAAPDAQDGIEFGAILDTGFTGFISMPIARAASLGLKPGTTTTEVELADGTVGARPLAEGAVIVGDKRVTGPIILEEVSNDVLAGMDFLRTFNLLLIVGSEAIVLIHEAELVNEIRVAMEKARSALKRPGDAKQIESSPSGSEEPRL